MASLNGLASAIEPRRSTIVSGYIPMVWVVKVNDGRASRHHHLHHRVPMVFAWKTVKENGFYIGAQSFDGTFMAQCVLFERF